MQSSAEFSLFDVSQSLFRYRWYVLIFVAVSMVLAFILTLPMIYKPEFKSTTVIYPTNSSRFDMTNMFKLDPDILLYGDAKEVERIENLVSSDEVKLAVADSVNLWEAYGIDRWKDKSPKNKLLKSIFDNLKGIQVEGNGLRIEAFDIEPERAAAMVRATVATVDLINKRMITKNKDGVLRLYEEGLKRRQQQMVVYTDSIRKIRTTYNVFNAVTQTEVVVQEVMRAESRLAAAQEYLRARLKDKTPSDPSIANAREEVSIAQSRLNAVLNGANGSTVNLKNFREGVDQVLALEQACETIAREMQSTQQRVDYLRMMTSEDFSTLVISGEPQVSDKKARPVRWVILLATLIGALLASAITAILVDRLKTISLPKAD